MGGDSKTNKHDAVIRQTSQNLEPPSSPSSPPYMERLTLENPSVCLEFDQVSKLRNICIKVPLLQAIKNILIYLKNIRDIFLRKLGRKMIEP